MFDFKRKIYTVNNGYDVDRQNFIVDTRRPYIIICGAIGVGKSAYIKAMKVHNPDMQYLKIGNIDTVYKYVINKAIKIIEIKELFKEDLL